MTEFNIDGEIVIVKTKPKVIYAIYEDGLHYIDNNPLLGENSKTIIEPTGAFLSIIGLAHSEISLNIALANSGNFGGFSGFILSDNFEIGDIVEIYKVSDIVNLGGSTEAFITDSDGHTQIGTSNTHSFHVIKKVFSGTGNDWFTYS
jgi:hypothetical protein